LADVSEVLKYSAAEKIAMIIAMEEFFEDNGITEISKFSR